MDPFKQMTHGGPLSVAEILFHTSFGCMFPLLAENPECAPPPGSCLPPAFERERP